MTFIVVASKTPFEKKFLVAQNGFERNWWRWPDGKLDEVISSDAVLILTDDYAPVERLMSGVVLSGLH